MSENDGLCAYPNCTCRPEQRCPSVRSDPVNRPAHYRTGRIEVIDFLRDQDFGYLAGNVVKYVSRYRHKGKPLEDLRKARWYLQRLIDELEKEAGVMDEAQEKAVQQVARELSAKESEANHKQLLALGANLCAASADGRHTWTGPFPSRAQPGRFMAFCANGSCRGACYTDPPKDGK